MKNPLTLQSAHRIDEPEDIVESVQLSPVPGAEVHGFRSSFSLGQELYVGIDIPFLDVGQPVKSFPDIHFQGSIKNLRVLKGMMLSPLEVIGIGAARFLPYLSVDGIFNGVRQC